MQYGENVNSSGFGRVDGNARQLSVNVAPRERFVSFEIPRYCVIPICTQEKSFDLFRRKRESKIDRDSMGVRLSTRLEKRFSIFFFFISRF